MIQSCGSSEENDGTDEFEASVQVSASSLSVSESAQSVTFTVSLNKSNLSGSALEVPLTISGTATSGQDYESVSDASVMIATNASSAQLTINLIDDAVEESDETIMVSLGSLPTELSQGSSASSTVTITDNDAQSSQITLSFDTSSGNTITVDSWTDVSADTYIIVINNTNSFSSLIGSSTMYPSTSYVGYGEQVIYNGSSISPFTISLLEFSSEYYFKIIPVTSGSYDNAQTSAAKSTISCVTTSTVESQVCFSISGDLRTISSNQVANHAVGSFPNADPTAIQVTRILDLTPSYTGTAVYVYDETGPPTPMNQNFWQFGMAVNGVEFHPMGLKPWTNPLSQEENWRWQAKVTDQNETFLDAYGAHVTTQGLYHYHGDIVGLADEDGTRHSKIYGFAADGFPIYYKYGFADAQDATSGVMELESSYRMKSGTRSDTGVAGEDYPSGTYDGTYIQDFEYVQGLGDLDECNGRTGVTPEYPGGTYYYVITTEFPVVPNCFFGTPDSDWVIGK